MQSNTQLEEEEFRDTKVPYLRVATGGKTPPRLPGYNWLKDLTVDTVFTCKKNDGNLVDLYMFHITFKHPKTTILLSNLNQEIYVPVDPAEFSRCYTMFEVIEEPSNEQRNRTD